MKKKLLILTVLIAIFEFSSIAQKRPTTNKNKMILGFSEELNLTSEQIEQIKKIQSENVEKNKILKEKQKQINEELMVNNVEMRHKIKDVLTTEQFEKLKNLIKDSLKNKRELRKKTAMELKEYNEKNIKPVISLKRKDFDKLLNETEKKIIGEYIAKHKALKESKFKDSNPEILKERRKALQKETSIALKPIIKKHKDELEKILNDLKPQYEKWQADIKEIKTKNGNTEYAKQNERKHEQNFNKKNAAIKFLLYDFEE
ncbi:MAG: hypothetical protein HUU47_07710 [Bacteroidetes bacterium]|nr:hypothetical protein [Bacteroidota bacterium]